MLIVEGRVEKEHITVYRRNLQIVRQRDHNGRTFMGSLISIWSPGTKSIRLFKGKHVTALEKKNHKHLIKYLQKEIYG